jgi:hypothetical protein
MHEVVMSWRVVFVSWSEQVRFAACLADYGLALLDMVINPVKVISIVLDIRIV